MVWSRQYVVQSSIISLVAVSIWFTVCNIWFKITHFWTAGNIIPAGPFVNGAICNFWISLFEPLPLVALNYGGNKCARPQQNSDGHGVCLSVSIFSTWANIAAEIWSCIKSSQVLALERREQGEVERGLGWIRAAVQDSLSADTHSLIWLGTGVAWYLLNIK